LCVACTSFVFAKRKQLSTVKVWVLEAVMTIAIGLLLTKLFSIFILKYFVP